MFLMQCGCGSLWDGVNKKDRSFFTAFFTSVQSCHYHSVLLKGRFRDCVRPGTVRFYSQSGSADGESHERKQEDEVLFLAPALPQRMTLAEALNLTLNL